MATYSIKKVSALTGLPASTLRYYESVGIINSIERDPSSKQRVYSETDLEELTGIACLSAAGLSIDEMRTYLENYQEGAHTAHEQIKLLEGQQQRLAKEARLLKVRQQYIALKIDYWQAVDAGNDTEVAAITEKANSFVDILQPRKKRT